MMRKQKCFYAKNEEIQRDWVLIDATDKILGRLATKISMILRGKDTPQFTPSSHTGRNVIVIHAEKIRVTGQKEKNKNYFSISGYPGGCKKETYEDLMRKDPTKILRKAVEGMLPDNRLKSYFVRSLKIYCGADYLEKAQKVQILD